MSMKWENASHELLMEPGTLIHIHKVWALTDSGNVMVASSAVILFWLLINNVSKVIEGSACCYEVPNQENWEAGSQKWRGKTWLWSQNYNFAISWGYVKCFHELPLSTFEKYSLKLKKKKKPVTFRPSHFLDLTCPMTIHHFKLEEGVVSPDLEVGLDLLHWFS